MSEQTITKVKHDPNKEHIIIHYENIEEHPNDVIALESNDRAKGSFYDALNELCHAVEIICELPNDAHKRITVRGVSFTHKDDIMGVSITALLQLNNTNTPLVLNTPHKPSTSGADDSENTNSLSEETVTRLNNLIFEAKRYINGDRDVTKQADIFDHQETEELIPDDTLPEESETGQKTDLLGEPEPETEAAAEEEHGTEILTSK